jgi:hypothetical protein
MNTLWFITAVMYSRRFLFSVSIVKIAMGKCLYVNKKLTNGQQTVFNFSSYYN